MRLRRASRSTRSATSSASTTPHDAGREDACSPARITTPCATAASTTAGSASSCRWSACASCTAPAERLPFALRGGRPLPRRKAQRYKATFLGSGALVGQFDPRWLEQRDADGVTMQRRRCAHAGLPATQAAIARLKRRPADYLGFVEVHIEQGPVLNELGLPLGVVTSINGGVRFAGEVTRHGEPRRNDADGRAGATPPRPSPSSPLYLEKRAGERAEPGRHRWACSRCRTDRPTSSRAAASSLSTSAPPRTRCATPASTTCSPRLQRDLRASRPLVPASRKRCAPPPAPCAPEWQVRWERAVAAAGLPRAPHAERRRPRRDEAGTR